MKIMVVGAGAVGGFLANKLLQGGHQVSVVARGEHLAAIRRGGLTLREADGSERTAMVEASDNPSDFGSQDLILTTVKAPALEAVLEDLHGFIQKGTPLVSALNGVFWWYASGWEHSDPVPNTSRLDPDNRIAALVDADQAMGMVIHSTNEVLEPGLIQNRSNDNRFVLGGATLRAAEQAQKITAQLSVPGITFEATTDLRSVMWRKLLRNLSTAPVSVLTGARAYDVLNDPDAGNVAQALFLEGAAVAASHGFAGLDQELAQVFKPGSGALQKPSMCQDVELGRPMEIDTILQVVQDFGNERKIPTPTLDSVIALVLLRARLAGSYAKD